MIIDIAVADFAIGTNVFSRYWIVIGIVVGLAMLAVHRLVAPDEW